MKLIRTDAEIIQALRDEVRNLKLANIRLRNQLTEASDILEATRDLLRACDTAEFVLNRIDAVISQGREQ